MTTYLISGLLALAAVLSAETKRFEYRVLATTKTSTMEKEMNDAADAGFTFDAVMGGQTAFGGKEVIAVMSKPLEGAANRKKYRLLATSKTSTMEKEMQAAAEEGFVYRGQTVFESAFGGREVSLILERDLEAAAPREEYRLQATSKTSTMQKELQSMGAEGFRVLGMTVGKTAFGGAELVCILGRSK
jgi:hypothetical protein